MKRRSLVSSLGASALMGFQGCLQRVETGDTESVHPSGTEGVRSGENEGVHPVPLALASVDSLPEDIPLDIGVEMQKSNVTDSHPGRLRIGVEFTGSEPQNLSISGGKCALFDRSGGRSAPSGLWLYRNGKAETVRRKDDRWIPVDDERGQYDGYGCALRRFEPEETVSTEYQVWDHDEGRYFEPGTYRWAETITVTSPEPIGDEANTEFRWGFSLRVGR